MITSKRIALPAALALAATAAACGSSTKTGSSGSAGTGSAPASTSTNTAAQSQAHPQGGIAEFAASEDLDYWDGSSYYGDIWAIEYTTCNGLLDYPDTTGADAGKLIPGVAADLPKISADGKTYTFTIRQGLKFSDGTPLTPDDVKATYEKNLDPASGFLDGALGSGYYNEIVGMDKYAPAGAKAAGAPGISGITISGNDVNFALTKPDPAFAYATALRFMCIEKKGAPHKHTTTPAPMTGPYMITKVQPGHRIEVRRNPQWFANNMHVLGLDSQKGKLWNIDGFNITIGPSSDQQLLQIENNQLDYSFGHDAPAGSQVPQIGNDPKYKDRFFSSPDASTRYWFMNNSIAPFNNLKLRQAVNYAIDRTAMNKISGGDLSGEPWSSILPRVLDGNEKGDIYPYTPDTAKAKQLITESGVKTPIAITVTIGTRPPQPDLGQEIKSDLDAVGFKVTLQKLPAAKYYGYISDPKNKVQLGWAGWGEDYPDAVTFFNPLLKSTSAGGGSNYGQVQDKNLDAQIDKVNLMPLGDARFNAWAKLSTDYTTSNAPWAVYRSNKVPAFVSTRLKGYAYNPTKQIYYNLLWLQK
jgi:peptide/nickel transport system substrate-binding protein